MRNSLGSPLILFAESPVFLIEADSEHTELPNLLVEFTGKFSRVVPLLDEGADFLGDERAEKRAKGLMVFGVDGSSA